MFCVEEHKTSSQQMATFSVNLEERQLLASYNRLVVEAYAKNNRAHGLPEKDRELFFIRFPKEQHESSIRSPSDEVCIEYPAINKIKSYSSRLCMTHAKCNISVKKSAKYI